MVTNGVYFKEELYKYIKDYDIKITISLDGSRKVNDQLRVYRNGKDTYTEVIGTINKLRQQETEAVMIEATYTCIHEKENVTRNELVEELKKKTGIETILVADCEGEYAPSKKEKSEIKKLKIMQMSYILHARYASRRV